MLRLQCVARGFPGDSEQGISISRTGNFWPEQGIRFPHCFRPFQWFEPLQKLIAQPSLGPSSTALPRRAIRHDAQGPYPAQQYGNPKADLLSIPKQNYKIL